MKNIFTKMMYEIQKKHDVMIVTVISHKDSSLRETGKQMLVDKYGGVHGTIGGGAAEEAVREKALELLKEKKSSVCDFVIKAEEGQDKGMVCGADIRVHFQYIPHDDIKWQEEASKLLNMIENHESGYLVLMTDGSHGVITDYIHYEDYESDATVVLKLPVGERAIIFGCGHCCKALVPILASVGFRVTVYDDRPEITVKENYPAAETIICDSYENIDAHIKFTADDYVLVMTSGHMYDYYCEKKILENDFAYLGVMGSKKKKASIDARLLKEGISQDKIDRAHLPVGIHIKSKTPQEIAVSIAAEMIFKRALNRERQ